MRLTKRREKWVANRKTTLKGTGLRYNAAQQERYVKALGRLVNKMTDETKKQVMKLFNGELSDEFFTAQEEASAMDASLSSQARILMNMLTKRFSQLFNNRAGSLATTMILGAAKTSTSTVHKSLEQLTGGLSLKTSVVSAGQEEVATALIAENVSLIKSIPQQYFKDITGSVMRSITSGDSNDLLDDIRKYEGQTERRAKNLALDQTRKAYTSINVQKLTSIGVKQFIWGHSSGGLNPRDSHIMIDGMTFSFENLEAEQAAAGVPKADRGLPSYPPNCKCFIQPIIKFKGEE